MHVNVWAVETLSKMDTISGKAESVLVSECGGLVSEVVLYTFLRLEHEPEAVS